MTNSIVLRTVSAALVVIVLGVGFYVLRHSDDGDPQNVKYILWKAGLYKMGIDQAVFTMVRDPHRDELVVGKTKQELRHRFGDLLTLDQVSEYYRDGHNRGWKDKDALFIRNSPWMIVFDQDKATELVLMKGY
jgi:hypothetical protein